MTAITSLIILYQVQGFYEQDAEKARRMAAVLEKMTEAATPGVDEWIKNESERSHNSKSDGGVPFTLLSTGNSLKNSTVLQTIPEWNKNMQKDKADAAFLEASRDYPGNRSTVVQGNLSLGNPKVSGGSIGTPAPITPGVGLHYSSNFSYSRSRIPDSRNTYGMSRNEMTQRLDQIELQNRERLEKMEAQHKQQMDRLEALLLSNMPILTNPNITPSISEMQRVWVS